MNYHDAIQWLYSAQQFGIKLGLENVRRLMDALGNPERKLRFIHVAGTNGKGSTCAMMAAACEDGGLKTGLFTSPHLIRFTERIQINGSEMPMTAAADGLSMLRDLTENWEVRPTFFELAFALAVDWFARCEADIVLLETGMGGRLDATNIVTPLVSVITAISLDHEEWLGNTLGAIAREKAGIIKPGVPVVVAPQVPEVACVLEEVARARAAPLTTVAAPWSQGPINLPGPHQASNAAVAAAALQAAGLDCVGMREVRSGIARARWPARFQFMDRRVVLDGAHNPGGAEMLLQTWRALFPHERATVIFSAVARKDVRQVIRILAPLAARWIPVQVQTNRGLPLEELAALCREMPGEVTPAAGAQAALGMAREFPDRILVAGSLYLCGEMLALAEGGVFETSDQ